MDQSDSETRGTTEVGTSSIPEPNGENIARPGRAVWHPQQVVELVTREGGT